MHDYDENINYPSLFISFSLSVMHVHVSSYVNRKNIGIEKFSYSQTDKLISVLIEQRKLNGFCWILNN